MAMDNKFNDYFLSFNIYKSRPLLWFICQWMVDIKYQALFDSLTLCIPMDFPKYTDTIWALLRQNLSSGFSIRLYQNQPAQLQRLAMKLKFRLKKVMIF